MNYINLYADFLFCHLKPKKQLTIVFDSSNGPSSLILKNIFLKDNQQSSLIRPHFINDKPDGNFPGHGPNPSHEGALDQLCRAVRKYKADLGVIFDGDADRVLFVNDQGAPLSVENK